MKFIKRTKLTFTEGNSDKVYEVDLCELMNDSEQRFLVNFRYGRRGSNLKEGTKTPVPASFQNAEDIFNSLVVSKTNKGYVDSQTPSLPRVPRSDIPFDLNSFLVKIDEEKDSNQRARMIWRLPQQTNTEIADFLVQKLNQSQWVEDYSRLWVIGRTGDSRHARALESYLDSSNSKLADLALEVLLKFDNSKANRIKQACFDILPRELADAITHDNSVQVFEQLNVYLTNKKSDHYSLLKALYLIAINSPALHQALVEIIKTLPLAPGWFRGLRYIFKMSEFRLDSEIFAILSYRFETTRHHFVSDWYWNYSRGSGQSRLDKEMAKPDSGIAFSNKTRDYFRRRSWRTLKRLGVRNDDRYADMAAHLLLAFSETDKKPERSIERYSWENRRNDTYEYDGYASYLALNAILRSNSTLYKRSLSRQSWLKVSNDSENHRTEAFPDIWDRRPELLLNLIINGRAEIVGEFAIRALKDNSAFCEQITDEQLYQLLTSAMQIAIEFAAELLKEREISHSLLILLFRSGNEKARAIAINALKQIKDVFVVPELLTRLLLIDYEELNHWLTTQFANHSFSFADYDLLNNVSDELLLPDASLSETHAAWLANLLIKHIESGVRDLPIEKIEALFAQNNVGIQLFAACLLNANRITFREIPQPVLEKINNADSAAIRAIGIGLFSKTSEYELLNQLPLLVELVYRGENEERHACLQILEKLSKNYAQQVFGQLLPLVFKEEIQAGQQDELFDFINQHLVKERNALDKDTVWRLIHASSAAAQRLGVETLCVYDMRTFTVKQWVVLANNPNQRVRSYTHQSFEKNIDFVKENSRNALRLLESGWQDSREFGFAFFNQHYQESDWTVELIVSICDSNLTDTQRYGRELLQPFFKQEQGEEYLQKLSQHPSMQVQAFVANLLNDYAADKPDVIVSLKHYFTSVLSQINKGRVGKDCVLAFLIKEANSSPAVLTMVAELFTRLSLTLVHKDKSQLIKAMLMLKKQHPDLDLPIETKPVRVLAAVQGENHAS